MDALTELYTQVLKCCDPGLFFFLNVNPSPFPGKDAHRERKEEQNFNTGTSWASSANQSRSQPIREEEEGSDSYRGACKKPACASVKPPDDHDDVSVRRSTRVYLDNCR